MKNQKNMRIVSIHSNIDVSGNDFRNSESGKY